MKFPTLRPAKPTGTLSAYADAGHLLACPDGVWAYYALAGQDMLGRTEAEVMTVQRAQAHRWGELRGHRVMVRQTSHPWDDHAWAKRIDREHPHPDEKPTPNEVSRRLTNKPGAPTFKDVLTAGQAMVQGAKRRKSASVLGVRISTRRIKGTDLDVVLRPEPVADAKLEAIRAARVRIDTAVAKPGFEGTPLAPNSIAWLTHASLGMGAPVPPILLDHPGRKSWDEGAIAGFTNPVQAHADPYSLFTELHIARESEVFTRHVAVQYVERFMDRHQLSEPFLAWTLAYPEPLEILGVFDVIDGAKLKRQAEKARRKARDIQDHNLEHGDDPLPYMARGIELALQIEDEFHTGDTPTRTRLRGCWVIAVARETEHEARGAAKALAVAAEEQAGAVLAHDFGQFDLYRAFTPGEPFPFTGGYQTQVSAKYAASALVPNVSVEAGDPTGFLVGPVYGGRDMMTLDPFGGAHRNLSGVQLECGNQGSGKSALAGALLWWTSRLGIRTVGIDPSGPWKALTALPDLKGDAHYLDMASAAQGTLVPSVMVPEPRLADHDDDRVAWREAVASADANRVELMVDTLAGLLPYGFRQEERKHVAVLTTACAEVGGAYGEDPWRYVSAVEQRGTLGREIADLLRAASELRGTLVFPKPGTEVDPEKARRVLNRATLTIIGTHGLAMPPSNRSDPATWTPAQQAAPAILNLMVNLATLAMYSDRNEPTHVAIDELRQVASIGSSLPSFINRIVTDTRKWRAFVNLLFHAPKMVTDIDESIGNLAGQVLIGRLDKQDAALAKPLLRDDDPDSLVPELVQDQTAGEFVVRDWLGRRRQVYVDQSWWSPELLAALDTTPGGRGRYDDSPSSLFGVPA